MKRGKITKLVEKQNTKRTENLKGGRKI